MHLWFVDFKCVTSQSCAWSAEPRSKWSCRQSDEPDVILPSTVKKIFSSSHDVRLRQGSSDNLWTVGSRTRQRDLIEVGGTSTRYKMHGLHGLAPSYLASYCKVQTNIILPWLVSSAIRHIDLANSTFLARRLTMGREVSLQYGPVV